MTVALFLVLIFFSFFLNGKIDEKNTTENLLYFPNGKFLKGASLCYDNIFADLLWLKAIGYFADHYQADKNYTWLYHILNIITDLDPYYQDPYEFGGVVLASEIGDVNHSSLLLKKGMKNVPKTHPRYWYLPFYLGFNYWYYNWDFKNGAKYLEMASKFPRSPEYLPMLTARMYADADSAEIALPFLDEMIATAKTEKRKEQLIKRRKDVLVTYHLDILDMAVKKYYEKFGRYPNSTESLVTDGIIKEIPKEPFGGEYYYDFLTKKFLSTKSERIKVHERKDGF